MSANVPFCPTCHLGKLRVRKVSHAQAINGRLVVISNVPAAICDVCGERVLDDDVLYRLSGLLSPDDRRSHHARGRP